MQTTQITRISVFQTSKVTGVLYTVVGLIYIPLGWFADSAAAPDDQLGALWLIMPLILGVIGFIAVALMAALYNFVASRMGGIEFSLSGQSDLSAP